MCVNRRLARTQICCRGPVKAITRPVNALSRAWLLNTLSRDWRDEENANKVLVWCATAFEVEQLGHKKKAFQDGLLNWRDKISQINYRKKVQFFESVAAIIIEGQHSVALSPLREVASSMTACGFHASLVSAWVFSCPKDLWAKANWVLGHFQEVWTSACFVFLRGLAMKPAAYPAPKTAGVGSSTPQPGHVVTILTITMIFSGLDHWLKFR